MTWVSRRPSAAKRLASRRRSVWFGCALLGVAVAFPLLPSPAAASDFWDAVRNPHRQAYERLVQEATVALNARRPADAVGPARQAVALIEDDARGHLLTALAAAEGAPTQGHAEDGVVQSLQRAWTLSPDAFVVWVDRVARALVTRGALPFAERVVLRGVQTRPPGPGRGILYMQLANLRMAQGPAHLPSAIEAYGHAAQDGITDSLSLRLAQRRVFDLRGGVGSDPRAVSNMPLLPGRPVLESELHRYPLPETEALARRAYWHELRGDRAEAIATWNRITEGPWAPLAAAAAQELQTSRSSR